MKQDTPSGNYGTRILNTPLYHVEMAYDASRASQFFDNGIRFRGGDKVTFEGTSLVAVRGKTTALPFYIMGELLEPDKSIDDKAKDYAYKVIGSDVVSILKKILNGYSYLAKMGIGEVNDQASNLETVLMFDKAELRFFDALRKQERTEGNYRQIGQAVLMLLGRYDAPVPDVLMPDVRNQLTNWFNFSAEQTETIIKDYRVIRDLISHISHKTAHPTQGDYKKLDSALVGIALLYKLCGQNKPKKEDFLKVAEEMAGLGLKKKDFFAFGEFAEPVYQRVASADKPEHFGQSQTRLRKIKIDHRGNKEKILEHIASEFNGDIRLYLEHMNPVENYFLVVTPEAERDKQEKIRAELEKIRRGEYRGHIQEILALINENIGGGALALLDVISHENRKLYNIFMEFQHNDGAIDKEEAAILSEAVTQNPDMNKARLTRLKIHALITDNLRWEYHKIFSQIAVEVARDKKYELSEWYDIKLALGALVGMGLFSDQLARYEEIKINEACENVIRLDEHERQHIEKFLDSLSKVIFYGMREGAGSGMSKRLVAENLMDYLELHYTKGLGEKVKGTFLLDRNTKIDTQISKRNPSHVSRLITSYRNMNGLVITDQNKSVSEDDRCLADLILRQDEHNTLTNLYGKIEDLGKLDHGRLFGSLPELDEMITVLYAKEALDFYTPEIFIRRVEQVMTSPLLDDEADMDWRNKMMILTNHLVESSTMGYKDAFCMEKYNLPYKKAIEGIPRERKFRLKEFAAYIKQKAEEEMVKKGLVSDQEVECAFDKIFQREKPAVPAKEPTDKDTDSSKPENF